MSQTEHTQSTLDPYLNNSNQFEIKNEVSGLIETSSKFDFSQDLLNMIIEDYLKLQKKRSYGVLSMPKAINTKKNNGIEPRKTLVFVDLPNIINSFKREYKNKYSNLVDSDLLFTDKDDNESVPFLNCPPKIWDILFETILKDYNIGMIKVFTTPAYQKHNNYLEKLGKNRFPMLSLDILKKWDELGNKWMDIDEELLNYLYYFLDLKATNDSYISRIILFGSDHIYLPVLEEFALKKIPVHVVCNRMCCGKRLRNLKSNVYEKFSGRFWRPNHEILCMWHTFESLDLLLALNGIEDPSRTDLERVIMSNLSLFY